MAGSSQAWAVAWEKEVWKGLKIKEVGAEYRCQKLAAGRSWPPDSEWEMTDSVNTGHERHVKWRQVTLAWCDRGKWANKDTCDMLKAASEGNIFPEMFWANVSNFVHHIHQAEGKGCCLT